MAQHTTLAPYGTPGPVNVFQSKWGPFYVPDYCAALNLAIDAPELVIELEPMALMLLEDDLMADIFQPELMIDLEPELTAVCP